MFLVSPLVFVFVGVDTSVVGVVGVVGVGVIGVGDGDVSLVSCYFVSLLAGHSGQSGQVVSLVSLVSLLLLVVSVCDVLLLLLFCLPSPQKGRTRLTQHVRFAWVLSIALTLGSLLHAAAWDAIRFMLASQIESLAHFRGCQLFCGRSEGNSAPAPARAPLSAPCTCVWRGGREAGEEEEGLNSSRQPMCQAISWHGTSPRRRGRIKPPPRGRPVRRVSPRHCRTGHRGLKSMTEELGGFRAPHRWECLTVKGEAPRDMVPLRPLCAHPNTKLPQQGRTC